MAWADEVMRVTTDLSAWVMAGVLLLGAPGVTDAPFRITYTVKARAATATVLEGRVFNDGDRTVLDVWVTAEGLSASGKVLTTGIAFVSPRIARSDGAGFIAKVPFVEGVESFRVAVTSYRSGQEVQSP